MPQRGHGDCSHDVGPPVGFIKQFGNIPVRSSGGLTAFHNRRNDGLGVWRVKMQKREVAARAKNWREDSVSFYWVSHLVKLLIIAARARER